MRSQSSWTNLSVFVNGELIAWTNGSGFVALDHTTKILRLGRDAASSTCFTGLVDEFRLYKTWISQDTTRGLMWFLRGSNNVIIPRGVFFASKMFAGLNGTFDGTSPLSGATVHGNDNKGSASLNSRVIQMVIAKNLTLADASRILDLARTNATNAVTAFPLLVASEFYTLGLAKEVRDLAANAVVENSGNHSAPAPNPTLWELYWNAINGLVSAAWNAVVAVGTFFVNVVKFLIQAAISVVKGLVTGDWSDFQTYVLEPLRKALEAFLKFIWDLIAGLIDAILKPILDPLVQLLQRAFAGLAVSMHFSRLTVARQFFAIVGSIVTAISILTVALLVIELATIVFTGVVPGLVPTLIGLLRPMILAIFISHAIEGVFGVLTEAESGQEPDDSVIGEFFGSWLSALEFTYGITQGIWAAVGEATKGKLFSPAAGLAFALIGLMIALWADSSSGLALLALDVAGVLLAIYGVVATALGGGFAWGSISWVIRLESVLTVASAIATFMLIGKRAIGHEDAYGI